MRLQSRLECQFGQYSDGRFDPAAFRHWVACAVPKEIGVFREMKDQVPLKESGYVIVNISVADDGVVAWDAYTHFPFGDRVHAHLTGLAQGLQKLADRNALSAGDSCSIVHFMSDRFPYQSGRIDLCGPIACHGCPVDRNFILIPDTEFFWWSPNSRWEVKGMNWASQKEHYRYLRQIRPAQPHVRRLFFNGTDTSNKPRASRVRGYLRDHGTPRLDVDASLTFVPLDNAIWYEGTLSLPGTYPWTGRLKQLYMLGLPVVHVSVITIGKGYVDPEWHSFVDLVVPPDLRTNITFFHDKRLEDDKIAVQDRRLKELVADLDSAELSTEKAQLALEYIESLTSDDIAEYYASYISRSIALGVPVLDRPEVCMHSKSGSVYPRVELKLDF